MLNFIYNLGFYKLSNLRSFELFDLYSSICCYILNVFFIVMMLMVLLIVDTPMIVKLHRSTRIKTSKKNNRLVAFTGIFYKEKVITEDPMYEFLHSLIPLLIVTSVFAPFYDFLIKKINHFLKLCSDLGVNTYKFKLIGKQ